MRLRFPAAAAASAVALLTLATSAFAGSTPAPASVPADSLRALGAREGLRIGTAIIPFDLDNAAYAQIAGQQFSSVTAANEMNWQVVEPSPGVFDWSGGDRLVQFAEQNGQLVRGDTLLWHNQLPAWLTTGVANGTISNDQLREVLHQHITTEVTHFKGKVRQWDVAAEFFADPFDPAPPLPDGINSGDFWVQHLGEGIIADAFRWAHEADPDARLFYNDFNIAGEDGTNLKSDHVYAWVKQMRAAGVPIQGVGDEAHLDTQFGFPTQMEQDLHRFASLGVKVAIAQADVRTFVNDATQQQPTDRLAVFAQSDFFDQLLKACLAERACISFTVWSFGDADSWVPGSFRGEGAATIYDVNLQPKPQYSVLQQDLSLADHGAPHRGDRDDANDNT